MHIRAHTECTEWALKSGHELGRGCGGGILWGVEEEEEQYGPIIFWTCMEFSNNDFSKTLYGGLKKLWVKNLPHEQENYECKIQHSHQRLGSYGVLETAWESEVTTDWYWLGAHWPARSTTSRSSGSVRETLLQKEKWGEIEKDRSFWPLASPHTKDC